MVTDEIIAVMVASVGGGARMSILILLSLPLSASLSCKLQKQFHLNGMHKAGDIVIGGLFEVHFSSVHPELTFTSEPEQPVCKG